MKGLFGVIGRSSSTDSGSAAVVTLKGSLHNERDLGALETLYERLGPTFVTRLDGMFAVAISDPRKRRTVLASDPFGSHPVYWHVSPKQFSFASELRTLIRALDEPPALSMKALADYLTTGFVLGDKTLASGISLLDPGTILTYDWTTGLVDRTKYFDPAELYLGPRLPRDKYHGALRSAFEGSVAKALSGPHRFGLSLSGGLDSRAVLSAVNGHAEQLVTYTLGVAGCADQVIANRLSRLAGTNHRFFALDDRYLRDFLINQQRMVSLTDGFYMSHGLTEMLALEFLEPTGIDVLLRGHGGELAKSSLAWPFHTDVHVRGLKTKDEVVEYLARRVNYISAGLPLDALFVSEAARLAGRGGVESMHEVLRDVSLPPPDLCSYLYLREHHRRSAVPSLELFRTLVDVRLPFIDRRFLQILLSAPAEWHDDTSVHQAITKAGNPALLKVRNSNTGAPGDASVLAEKILGKFNTLLRRLNTPGFRHYHHFDAWMRTKLLETVERELLAPEARTRLSVRPDVVQRLIAETRSRQADRGYLLQVLLIVELWQRENRIERIAA